MLERLAKEPGIEVQYVEVRDPRSLAPIEVVAGHDSAVVLVAARVGATRLIDNALVGAGR